MQHGVGSLAEGLINHSQQLLVVGHNGKRLRGTHAVEVALLDGVGDPQTFELHQGIAGLDRIQTLRATGDKPLLAVQPFLNQGKTDPAPAGVRKQLGFQLWVEKCAIGADVRSFLTATNSLLWSGVHTHAVLFLRRPLIWTVPARPPIRGGSSPTG